MNAPHPITTPISIHIARKYCECEGCDACGGRAKDCEYACDALAFNSKLCDVCDQAGGEVRRSE